MPAEHAHSLKPAARGRRHAQVAGSTSSAPRRAGSYLAGLLSPRARLEPVDLLDQIPKLSDEDLGGAWERTFGFAPPAVPQDLLRLLLGHKLQEDRHGGVDPKIEADLRERASEGEGRATASRSVRTPRAAKPPVGTRLVREWNGQTITVEVRQDGFWWQGACHASLSAIARKVTGARWSGPRFFGLTGGSAQ
jgi:hypothetical protein